jgi:glycosyltransferase involved in cell wall biosynthesis
LKSCSEVKQVDVLLATFNGENYLGAFLNSLKNQVGVKIILHVSDDGSTDQTLDILREHVSHFHEYHFYQNHHLGAKNNFAFLLRKSKSDFIAFADQDDLWFPNHLENSINRIMDFSTVPAGTFCDVVEFDATKNSQRRWPNIERLDRNFLFFENTVRGCSLLINSKARSSIVFSDKAIMHDWWIGLILQYTGILIYSSKPEILYRLHENNLIGARKNLPARIKRFRNSSNNGIWLPIQQLVEFVSIYSTKITPEKKDIFKEIQGILKKSTLPRRIGIVFRLTRYRRSFTDEILVRLIILLRG